MWIGKLCDSGSCWNFGLYLIEFGLDWGNCGVVVCGIDECLDGGYYIVFE